MIRLRCYFCACREMLLVFLLSTDNLFVISTTKVKFEPCKGLLLSFHASVRFQRIISMFLQMIWIEIYCNLTWTLFLTASPLSPSLVFQRWITVQFTSPSLTVIVLHNFRSFLENWFDIIFFSKCGFFFRYTCLRYIQTCHFRHNKFYFSRASKNLVVYYVILHRPPSHPWNGDAFPFE